MAINVISNHGLCPTMRNNVTKRLRCCQMTRLEWRAKKCGGGEWTGEWGEGRMHRRPDDEMGRHEEGT